VNDFSFGAFSVKLPAVDPLVIVAVVATGTGLDVVEEMEATNLENGVDGTVASKGKVLFDENYVYVALDDCTEAVSNWMKLPVLTGNFAVDTSTGEFRVKGDVVLGIKENTVVEPVASTITTDLGGTNDIAYTAITKGVVGDSIEIEYVLLPEITVDDGLDDLFTINLPSDEVDGTTIPNLTITQAGSETAFSIDTISKSAITITLGHDGTDPIPITVLALKTALEDEADWATAGYIFAIADDMGAENVPAVAVTEMDSVEAIDISGSIITVTLGTTAGVIDSDVASVIALFADNGLVTATANESDDQAIDDIGSWQLDNGMNGTVGEKGKILFDTDYIYIATDACTTAVSNWKKSTLASI
jgi:hypothetical protein